MYKNLYTLNSLIIFSFSPSQISFRKPHFDLHKNQSYLNLRRFPLTLPASKFFICDKMSEWNDCRCLPLVKRNSIWAILLYADTFWYTLTSNLTLRCAKVYLDFLTDNQKGSKRKWVVLLSAVQHKPAQTDNSWQKSICASQMPRRTASRNLSGKRADLKIRLIIICSNQFERGCLRNAKTQIYMKRESCGIKFV